MGGLRRFREECAGLRGMGAFWRFWEECGGFPMDGVVLEALGGVRRGVQEWEGSRGFGKNAEGSGGM